MSKVGAFIPARYAATRFPAKLMQQLGDKSVIRHTYDNTKATGLFDEVYVVTDSEIIFDEIVNNGGKAIMSKRSHESGSDRIAEAIVDLDIDIVVNVQGDEPFVKKEPLQKVIDVFSDASVQVSSLKRSLSFRLISMKSLVPLPGVDSSSIRSTQRRMFTRPIPAPKPMSRASWVAVDQPA